MSNYFYGAQHQPRAQNMHQGAVNHHGRSRRAMRMSASHAGNRQYRQQKITREPIVTEAPNVTAFRARFEAGRSFDLDDDMEFCPNLLTLDEQQSITSGLSDRSSLSSSSPDSSPLQHQIQPQVTPALALSNPTVMPPTSFHVHAMKLHQPAALRTRTNAIPIVNPSTGSRIASPPSSISPNMMQQAAVHRRW